MVLYQPKQEQHYYFLGADRSQYWFVHFTGRQVKNILKRCDIPLDGYIIHTGLSYEYEDLFRKMRAMYFSRLFRKEKGVSPLQYRKVFRAGLKDPDPASGN